MLRGVARLHGLAKGVDVSQHAWKLHREVLDVRLDARELVIDLSAREAHLTNSQARSVTRSGASSGPLT